VGRRGLGATPKIAVGGSPATFQEAGIGLLLETLEA